VLTLDVFLVGVSKQKKGYNKKSDISNPLTSIRREIDRHARGSTQLSEGVALLVLNKFRSRGGKSVGGIPYWTKQRKASKSSMWSLVGRRKLRGEPYAK